MAPRIQAIWDRIRTSLWAVPTLMVAAAVATAIYVGKLPLGQDASSFWSLYGGSAREATEFLSSLVGAMITMTTLAISITMVVLTLAAQQLGPRLIRIFMSDLRTQAALGLFVSTVVYLLLVLRIVNGSVDEVPNLAVTIGTGLVLLSIAMLLLFVHHLARSIISDSVIETVGADIDANAARLLPDRDGTDTGTVSSNAGRAILRLDCEGYVQAIDADAIVQAAKQENSFVSLDIGAGHHLVNGMTLGSVQPASGLTDDLQNAIRQSIMVGTERTPVQDLEFSIRQLVELAIRALSPGINDPYTALLAIDRLTRSLARIMRRRAAQTVWRDERNIARLVVPAPSFAELVDASFNMIRQYGSGSAAILIRLADSLDKLASLADPEQRKEIERHMIMVRNAGRRNIEEKLDLQAIEDRLADPIER